MEHLLAFRLHGPMASWGTVESGVERRPSTRDPGRGAVLGILAAALGLRRDEDDRHAALSEGLRIAVCGHGPRRLMYDFQTVQTVQPLRNEDFQTRGHALLEAQNVHTLTSWRQYVEDGLWRVFLGGSAAHLAALEQALQRPVFELYLGRRDYPLALPPDPQMVAGGLLEALDAYSAIPAINWIRHDDLDVSSWISDRICSHGNLDLWWDLGFPGAPEGNGRVVVDQPVSRTGWRFRSRELGWKTLRSEVLSANSFFDDMGPE